MAVLARDALVHRRAALQCNPLELLTDEELRELHEIEAALIRIDNNNFGQCEACGGRIGRQRLRALPETRYCVRCADQRDWSLRGPHAHQ
jgi:RNA polymerase-binding transcription factor DksA